MKLLLDSEIQKQMALHSHDFAGFDILPFFLVEMEKREIDANQAGINAFTYLFKRFGKSLNDSLPNKLATYAIKVSNDLSIVLHIDSTIKAVGYSSNRTYREIRRIFHYAMKDWYEAYSEFVKQKGIVLYTKRSLSNPQQSLELDSVVKSDFDYFVSMLDQESDDFKIAMADEKSVQWKELVAAFWDWKDTQIAEMFNEHNAQNPHPTYSKTPSEIVEWINKIATLEGNESLQVLLSDLTQFLNEMVNPIQLENGKIIEGVRLYEFFNLYGFATEKDLQGKTGKDIVAANVRSYLYDHVGEITDFQAYEKNMDCVIELGNGSFEIGLGKITLQQRNANTFKSKKKKPFK